MAKTQKEIKELLETKLSRNFGCSSADASAEQMYKASALTIRDMLAQKRNEFKKEVNREGEKRVYYMCMEFLMGRSLKTNLHNLGLEKAYKAALKSMGFDILIFLAGYFAKKLIGFIGTPELGHILD